MSGSSGPWHEKWCDGRLRATEEVLAVHVDTAAGRARPPCRPAVRAEVVRRLEPSPEQAGRRIAI